MCQVLQSAAEGMQWLYIDGAVQAYKPATTTVDAASLHVAVLKFLQEAQDRWH
jgi:hypothetical protein